MTYLLDDFSDLEKALFGTTWIQFTDQVLGGLSEGQAEFTQKDEHTCLKLSGTVKLNSMGGYIQASLPLVRSRNLFDASSFKGVYLRCQSPESEGYFIHLRSRELSMPWQHYRAAFLPGKQWTDCFIPFEAFVPTSTGHPLNPERLTRLDIVAGHKAFEPQLFLTKIGFYS